MSQYDLSQVYHFLLHTPEQGLRKMLVDPKVFPETYFNLLLKVVRGCGEGDFYDHFEKKTFPKVKMGPAEIAIKEKFWDGVVTSLNQRGLLTPAQKAA